MWINPRANPAGVEYFAGTFGNPNFQSAFMGIVGASALSLAAFSSFEIKIKASLILIVVVALYNISLSSQQGYLNLLAGFAAAFTVYLFSKKQVVLGWSFLGVFSLGVISVLLGILNNQFLHQILIKHNLGLFLENFADPLESPIQALSILFRM